MNEITFAGNISKIHETRQTRSGMTIVGCDLAVDNGYFDKARNLWMSRTHFWVHPARLARTNPECQQM